MKEGKITQISDLITVLSVYDKMREGGYSFAMTSRLMGDSNGRNKTAVTIA